MLDKYGRADRWVFFLFLVACGLLSLVLKFEVLWDFSNYHYYNPWAFLNNRVGKDVVVAGVNGFFNPLIDLPLYYLITYFNDYLNFIYFMQGLWSGLLAFLLYKTACLFFDIKESKGCFAILAVILLGMSGYAVFFQIGTSSNEIQISCLLVLSLWLLLREVFALKQGRNVIFFLAGLSAGSALGLKLTAFIYAIPLGLTLIAFYKYLPRPIFNILMFTLGGLFGFLLFDGFWLWKMWQMYDNPFFPFWNKLFRSEYFEIRNYTDDRFIPQSVVKFLFLPFYWFFNWYSLDGNVVVIDFRWGILYLFAVAAWIKHLSVKDKADAQIFFVIVFMLLSYILWISVFTIKRYMIPLEICSAILLVKAVLYLCPKSEKAKVFYWQFISALCFVAALTPIFSQIWGCRNCRLGRMVFEQFVAVDGVKIPKNTLLMFYNYPSAALLPYFNREAKNISGVSLKQKIFLLENSEKDMFNANSKWQKLKAEVIHNHKGLKVGVIAIEKDAAIKEILEEEPYFKGMQCRYKQSNIIPGFYFCIEPELKKEIFVDE